MLRILFLLLALSTLLLGACQRPSQQEAAAPEAGPMRIGPENTARVNREVIRTGPRLSGSLEPREQARLRAEVSGSVTQVKAELGKPVRKGQVLVRIEHAAIENVFSSAQSAVQSAQVQQENAKRQAERAQTLFDSGALAEQDLEASQSARTAAEAQLAQAQAQLAQARKQLTAASVESPMNGVVSEKPVNQGDIVTIGTPLFTVIDPSTMRLEASVPSEALPSLEVGARVDFAVRGYPGETFTGRIAQIAPAVDPATRQILTIVEIPNPGGKLLAGLFAEGRIGSESKETLVVPSAAIDRKGQEPAVLRVKNGKVDRVAVKLGLHDPQTERIEIEGEVSAGDVILTGAAKEIAPGTEAVLTGADRADSR